MKTIQRCTRCIMDNNSDTYITFNEKGECNYCTRALTFKGTLWFPNDEDQQKLEGLFKQLKHENQSKEYDCIVGISGGLDSSYLLYLGYQYGLRILCVHIDDGFDSDISKDNMHRLLEKTNYKCHIVEPDSKQYYALIKAYMYACVPNLAVPQDSIIFAHIFNLVKKTRVHTFLSGFNFATESILQRGNTYTSEDFINVCDIHRRFGTEPIDRLSFSSFRSKYINKHIYKLKTYAPLNYVPYTRETALKELADFCGFTYYGSKHLENDLTAFIQLYWFLQKFGVDKRTSHLSSLIMSNQITREEALEIYAQPAYSAEWMEQLIDRVLCKLELSRNDFDKIMSLPGKQHTDYKVSNFPKVVAWINRHNIPF